MKPFPLPETTAFRKTDLDWAAPFFRSRIASPSFISFLPDSVTWVRLLQEFDDEGARRESLFRQLSKNPSLGA